MQVQIHFQPDDGPEQTLYADMSREDFDAINRGVNGPDAENTFYTIPSRVEKDGPTRGWLFRASRIQLREE